MIYHFLHALIKTLEGAYREDILRGRHISDSKKRYLKVKQDKCVKEQREDSAIL